MLVHQSGAQRASTNRAVRHAAPLVVGLSIALAGLIAFPAPTTVAASVKVVVVVGPVEGNTSRYIAAGKGYADLARARGAQVIEVFSPNATWSKVKSAAKGADILIYLGHGNGYPSPYGPFAAERRNGMGLNAKAGQGHGNVTYYGQKPIRRDLELADGSVVLLNRLCYASGNSEPGRKRPSVATAKLRVDGYATGFIRAGAKAVFANGVDSLDSILLDLLTTDKSIGQIFQDDPAWTGSDDFKFASAKTAGSIAWLDPSGPGRYYRSVVGRLGYLASDVRD